MNAKGKQKQAAQKKLRDSSGCWDWDRATQGAEHFGEKKTL